MHSYHALFKLTLMSMSTLYMPSLWFRRWWSFRACTIWIIWRTATTTTKGIIMTIVPITRRVEVVSISTGRTIWASISTTTISSWMEVRVTFIIIRGWLMRVCTSIFLVTSMVTTFLLAHFKGASMGPSLDSLYINIPTVNTRGVPIMSLTLLIKMNILKTMPSRREHCRWCHLGSHMRHLLPTMNVDDISFCFIHIRMTTRRVTQINFWPPAGFAARFCNNKAYVMRTKMLGFTD